MNAKTAVYLKSSFNIENQNFFQQWLRCFAHKHKCNSLTSPNYNLKFDV